MTKLKTTIMQGWPDSKSCLPPELTTYFSYRDELTVQDGIVLRGDRVVIPLEMRSEMKVKVHAGHMGINSCLRRARQLLFWPGMSSDIRQYIESCDICATFADKQTPESLYMHDVPTRPWEKVGTDLLTLQNRQYLVTVDYHSNFFELDFLPDTTSKTVITKLKHHFARHGVPDTVVSDGGPQYTSSEFKSFAKMWGFTHELSSPGNSKANGAAEAAVKIAKRVMLKCHRSNEDPYIGLLNLRNTPTEGLHTSPVQRLFGRRTKTLIPTTHDKLKPSGNDTSDISVRENKRASIAHRQNQSRRDLKPLKVGDNIRMQPIQRGDKEWKPATVTKQLKSRTYEVTAPNGTKYRRNRQLLRASKATGQCPPVQVQPSMPQVPTTVTPKPDVPLSDTVSTPITDKCIDKASPPPSSSPTTAPKSTSHTPYKTRSGRLVKPVDKLCL